MSFNRPDDRIFDFNDRNTGFDDEGVYAERVYVERERRNSSGCCSCGCCLGCFGFLILIAVGFIALCYSVFTGGEPLRVSEETTVITEPLKSDGETVDFHLAIQAMIEPPGVQPDENAFMAIWRGYGREIEDVIDRVDARQQHLVRQQYRIMCEEFGIDPLAPSAWADAGAGLDAVRTAVARPHYFVPLVRQSEADLVVMSQPIAIYAFHEHLSDSLRQRARDRFVANDPAGAWQDMLASIRLFRHVTVHQAWLKEMDGRNSESLLTPVADIVATLPQWTPEQLAQAVRDLDTLPDWMDRQTLLTTMQFSLLDLVSATNDFSSLHGVLPAEIRDVVEFLFTIIAYDWNLVAKEFNREIENYGKLLEEVAGTDIENQFNLLRLRRIGEPRNIPVSPEGWRDEFGEFSINRVRETGDHSLHLLSTPGRSRLIGAFIGHRLIPWGAGEMYRLQLIEDSRIEALRQELEAERLRRVNGQ